MSYDQLTRDELVELLQEQKKQCDAYRAKLKREKTANEALYRKTQELHDEILALTAKPGQIETRRKSRRPKKVAQTILNNVKKFEELIGKAGATVIPRPSMSFARESTSSSILSANKTTVTVKLTGSTSTDDVDDDVAAAAAAAAAATAAAADDDGAPTEIAAEAPAAEATPDESAMTTTDNVDADDSKAQEELVEAAKVDVVVEVQVDDDVNNANADATVVPDEAADTEGDKEAEVTAPEAAAEVVKDDAEVKNDGDDDEKAAEVTTPTAPAATEAKDDDALRSKDEAAATAANREAIQCVANLISGGDGDGGGGSVSKESITVQEILTVTESRLNDAESLVAPSQRRKSQAVMRETMKELTKNVALDSDTEDEVDAVDDDNAATADATAAATNDEPSVLPSVDERKQQMGAEESLTDDDRAMLAIADELQTAQQKLPVLVALLEKQSPRGLRPFQKRYVAVYDYNIYYSKTAFIERDIERQAGRKDSPIHCLPLVVVSVVERQDRGREFHVEARDPRSGKLRRYKFRCATAEDCMIWVRGLNEHKNHLLSMLRWVALNKSTNVEISWN